MLAFLKKYNINDALLLLILITLPLAEHWNSKILLLTALIVIIRLYKEFKISFPKISWLYLLFFLFSCISYFWSEDKLETFESIIKLLPFLLFSIGYKLFFSFKDIDKTVRISAIIFLLYGLILTLLAYFRYQETQDTETFFYHKLTAPLEANAIYIALLFGLVYIFLLYTVLFKESKSKTLDISLTILLFGFQLLLSSKMILSILILISLLFFIKYLKTSGFSKKKLSLGILLVISAVALIGTSTFTKNRFKEILNYKQIEDVFEKEYFGPAHYWNGLTLRLFQLRCFYEIEHETNFNSTLGTGFGASQPFLNQKYTEYDLYRGPTGKGENDGYFVYNLHNQYTQILIELGIFGGILILLMLYFFVLYPLTNKNILLLGVGLLFISFALTESYLFRQKGVVSFILFPLLATYQQNKQD
ncbi:MAG: O-antigen ligase family protein [Bacteroidales bacterium]|nr:O-antigen ligase family protein [Bacteroidales bacterium]